MYKPSKRTKQTYLISNNVRICEILSKHTKDSRIIIELELNKNHCKQHRIIIQTRCFLCTYMYPIALRTKHRPRNTLNAFTSLNINQTAEHVFFINIFKIRWRLKDP